MAIIPSFTIGHNKNKFYLEKIWKNNIFFRSLIFSGPKSVGKFTFALNLAQKIVVDNDISFFENLLDQRLIEKIKTKFYPDILIIGNEENQIITVEEVRKIHNFVQLTNYNAENKIIIIDNAENMNINAQNALLKLLEEPSLNSIFILIIDSSSKLLPTIKSRLTEIKFGYPTASEVEDILILNNINNDQSKILAQLGLSPGFIKYWFEHELFLIYKKFLSYIEETEKNYIYKFEKIINEFLRKRDIKFIYSIIELLFSQMIKYKLDAKDISISAEENSAMKKYLSNKSIDSLLILHQEVTNLIIEQEKFALDQRQIIYIILTKLKFAEC